MINLNTLLHNTASLSSARKVQDNNPVKTEFNAEQKPFQTHAGIKVGAAYAAVSTALVLGLSAIFNTRFKSSAGNEALSKFFKTVIFRNLPISIVSSFGCGYIVDKKINNKHKKLASDLKNKPAEDLMKTGKNIKKTEKGNVYYKSNVGANIGGALGLGVWALNTAVNCIHKKRLPRNVDVYDLLDSMITPVVGGGLLGMATDYISNKAAKKHADKQNG